MKSRSQSKSIIKNVWLPTAERQGGQLVLEIHSDNAGEFSDHQFIKELQSKGIFKRFNCKCQVGTANYLSSYFHLFINSLNELSRAY